MLRHLTGLATLVLALSATSQSYADTFFGYYNFPGPFEVSVGQSVTVTGELWTAAPMYYLARGITSGSITLSDSFGGSVTTSLVPTGSYATPFSISLILNTPGVSKLFLSVQGFDRLVSSIDGSVITPAFSSNTIAGTVTVAAVPVPAGLALLLAGLGGLFLMGFRKRRLPIPA
ncbi:MAG: hypothetical protein ACO1OG_12380 [Devosia sp.]